MPIRNVRRGHIFCPSVFADEEEEEAPTGGHPTRGSYNISREVSVSRNGLMRPILMWCSLMDLVLYVSTYVADGSYVWFLCRGENTKKTTRLQITKKKYKFFDSYVSQNPSPCLNNVSHCAEGKRSKNAFNMSLCDAERRLKPAMCVVRNCFFFSFN